MFPKKRERSVYYFVDINHLMEFLVLITETRSSTLNLCLHSSDVLLRSSPPFHFTAFEVPPTSNRKR